MLSLSDSCSSHQLDQRAISLADHVMLQTKRRKKVGAGDDAPAAGATESEQSDDEGVEQVGLD